MNFVDLKAQQAALGEGLRQRMDAVLDHCRFVSGPEIEELEERLARYVGRPHCICCSSGTDALVMGLMAHGVGPGDAVLVPTFTFVATAEAVCLVGATPVFVDVEPNTWNIDAADLRDRLKGLASGKPPAPGMPEGLTPRGIITVDLFGLCADHDAVNAVADEFGLWVLEDAAQSFGARRHGTRAGALAAVAATSFFPAKPLGCYGDGGAVFTSDDDLAQVMRSVRVHGQGCDRYDNVRIGLNARMDTLQAAVLLAKLDIFDNELRRREQIAQTYTGRLSPCVQTPVMPEPGDVCAWAQYTVACDNRDATVERLRHAGVPVAVYYPVPLHLQTAYADLGYHRGDCPAAERAADRVFSLPVHPYLDGDAVEQVVNAVVEAVGEARS